MDIAIRILKKQLRQEMKTRLATITSEEYLSANALIQRQFFQLEVVKKATNIMLYYSINHEVDTISLIMELLHNYKVVAIPICTSDKSLRAGVINSLAELVPGKFGLSEPGPTAQEIKPNKLDLIVVPGVIFDEKGYRLGRGAGYYDRFLAGAGAYKLGLAYDFQVVSQLPIESHDIPLNGLLTPYGFQNFSPVY